jgi:hypothetical protein
MYSFEDLVYLWVRFRDVVSQELWSRVRGGHCDDAEQRRRTFLWLSGNVPALRAREIEKADLEVT